MGTQTTSTASDVEPAALREAMSLLRSPPSRVDAGYIDVLGERDPLSGHRSWRVYRSRFLPRIYERYWRPTVSRALLGMRGPRIAEEREIVLEALRIEPGARVLDVGCGPGTFTGWFADAASGGLVVGLDPSPTMLERAVERGDDHVAYVRGDGAALPFGDGEFDAVCSIGVIHMMASPLTALAEMARVLAPSGRLAVGAAWGRKKRERMGTHLFALDELTAALAEHGMVDVEQRLLGRIQLVSAQKREG